jgi:hypothetical protein
LDLSKSPERQKTVSRRGEQFYRAYQQARHFIELKRKYDPEELFQNELYRKYGTASGE